MIISLSPYLPLSRSLSPCFLLGSYLLFFMQDPKNSHTRKRWYERAIEATTLWKALSKPIEFPINNTFSFSLWNWPKKTISKTTQLNQTANSTKRLRKSRSTASSTFSHVCLCAPISSSFTDVLVSPTPTPTPRRSLSYARSRSLPSSTRLEMNNARTSVEGRKIFRGKSLRDDVLMRRFVVEEEEAMKKVIMRGKIRRINEMEIIRKRNGMRLRTKNIGPSPLSRMGLAN